MLVGIGVVAAAVMIPARVAGAELNPPIDLGDLGGESRSEAINDTRVVVGTASLPDLSVQAFRWDESWARVRSYRRRSASAPIVVP
jgi:hypothetical protein